MSFYENVQANQELSQVQDPCFGPAPVIIGGNRFNAGDHAYYIAWQLTANSLTSVTVQAWNLV